MTAFAPESGKSDSQADVVAFLESGDAFGGIRPERIDTHAASVFLAGDRAWKLKRAVRFDYLDFSTADRRRRALEAELRLNRRTAPDLYLALHPITRETNGELAIGGKGHAIDWLLEMRRFAPEALFAHLADRGELDDALLMRLADRIREFHKKAQIVPADDGARRFRRIVEGNIASMAAFPEVLNRRLTHEIGGGLLDLTDKLVIVLTARARTGRVRHAHGDLHLANIALIESEPILFDCLEFSAELASVDILYDLAFLLMDLWQQGLRHPANVAFNRYLDLSPEDEGGIALMPLFLATRAVIRAHVLAAQARRANGDVALIGKARAHLGLATSLLKPAPPRLVAVGGLSGTGKSTLARAVGGDVGRAPGARILRSDVLRKRLAGVELETRLSTDHYSIEANKAVYTVMGQLASAALSSGQAVIVDAVFARPDERQAIETIAHKLGVTFDGLWLEAPGSTLVDRIRKRLSDASDADARVVLQQSLFEVGELGGWRKIQSSDSLDAVVSETKTVLGIT